MGEEKVTIKQLNSANVRMDNSVYAGRMYDISGDVNISASGTVSSIDGGRVKKAQGESASFSYWGEGNMQVTYNGVDAEEQCDIINAVNDFIASVKQQAESDNFLGQSVSEAQA